LPKPAKGQTFVIVGAPAAAPGVQASTPAPLVRLNLVEAGAPEPLRVIVEGVLPPLLTTVPVCAVHAPQPPSTPSPLHGAWVIGGTP